MHKPGFETQTTRTASGDLVTRAILKYYVALNICSVWEICLLFGFKYIFEEYKEENRIIYNIMYILIYVPTDYILVYNVLNQHLFLEYCFIIPVFESMPGVKSGVPHSIYPWIFAIIMMYRKIYGRCYFSTYGLTRFTNKIEYWTYYAF